MDPEHRPTEKDEAGQQNAPGIDQLLERILTEGIKPHGSEIARASLNGLVSVIFFDVAPDGEQAARSLGWRGGRSEFAGMNRTRAEKMASLLPKGDPARAWLRGLRGGRIFVVTGKGTLCVTDADAGYSLLPGSLDGGWMS